MAFKFIVLCALVACAKAGFINQAPVAYAAGPALAYNSYASAPVAYKSYAAAPVAYAAAPALAYKSYAAAPVAYPAPVAKTVLTKTVDAEYDPHPQYSYSYDVHDQLTGDIKSQSETRDGDVVQGSYSLIESDGTRRIVDYTADSHNGFNAVVRKEAAQVAVKAVAAPVVKTIAAAPVAYAAPAVAYKSYAAPALAYKSYDAPALAYKSYAAPAVAYKSYAAPAVAYKSYSAPLAYSTGYYH